MSFLCLVQQIYIISECVQNKTQFYEQDRCVNCLSKFFFKPNVFLLIKSKQYSQLFYVSYTDIVIRMELLINIRSLKLYEVHLKIDLNKAFNTLVNTCALDIQHFDGKIQKQVHCPVLTEIIITCHLSRVTFGKMSYLFLPRKTHGQHSLVSKRNSKKYGERMTFRSLF